MVLKEDGRLFLPCFTDQESGTPEESAGVARPHRCQLPQEQTEVADDQSLPYGAGVLWSANACSIASGRRFWSTASVLPLGSLKR